MQLKFDLEFSVDNKTEDINTINIVIDEMTECEVFANELVVEEVENNNNIR